MSDALYEIDVAAMLGYQKWTKFARDLREGRIPAPTRMNGQTKIWSRRVLEDWIDGTDRREPSSVDLARRLDGMR